MLFMGVLWFLVQATSVHVVDMWRKHCTSINISTCCWYDICQRKTLRSLRKLLRAGTNSRERCMFAEQMDGQTDLCMAEWMSK